VKQGGPAAAHTVWVWSITCLYTAAPPWLRLVQLIIGLAGLVSWWLIS
jgi:hypothetical protein